MAGLPDGCKCKALMLIALLLSPRILEAAKVSQSKTARSRGGPGVETALDTLTNLGDDEVHEGVAERALSLRGSGDPADPSKVAQPEESSSSVVGLEAARSGRELNDFIELLRAKGTRAPEKLLRAALAWATSLQASQGPGHLSVKESLVVVLEEALRAVSQEQGAPPKAHAGEKDVVKRLVGGLRSAYEQAGVDLFRGASPDEVVELTERWRQRRPLAEQREQHVRLVRRYYEDTERVIGLVTEISSAEGIVGNTSTYKAFMEQVDARERAKGPTAARALKTSTMADHVATATVAGHSEPAAPSDSKGILLQSSVEPRPFTRDEENTFFCIGFILIWADLIGLLCMFSPTLGPDAAIWIGSPLFFFNMWFWGMFFYNPLSVLMFDDLWGLGTDPDTLIRLVFGIGDPGLLQPLLLSHVDLEVGTTRAPPGRVQ